MSLTTTVTEEQGRYLYHNNRVMKDIANVLNHPEFATFFATYFTNWETAKSMLMLIKVHQQLDNQLTGYEKLAHLFDLMSQSEFRAGLVHNMNTWITNDV